MARSRASPSRSAPSRPAAAPAAPAKPAAPHSSNNTHATSAQQSTPQVTNIYVQRGGSPMGGMGGGGGSGMLGTMAAVAGGSVLGHGISNYLYGNSTAAPSQPAEAQQLAAAANQENNVCAPQLTGYAKCMDANANGAESCGWAWDYFLQCRQQNNIQ